MDTSDFLHASSGVFKKLSKRIYNITHNKQLPRLSLQSNDTICVIWLILMVD